MKLKQKTVVFAITATAIALALAVGYFSISAEKQIKQDQRRLMDSKVREMAAAMENELEHTPNKQTPGQEELQEVLEGLSPGGEATLLVISGDGTVRAHPQQRYVGQPLEYSGITPQSLSAFKKQVGDDRAFSFHATGESDEPYYVTLAPFQPEETGDSWYTAITIPHQNLYQPASRHNTLAWMLALAALAITGLAGWYLARIIVPPLHRLKHTTGNIARGDVDPSLQLDIQTGDEIEELSSSLNQFIEGYAEKINFASSISQGNLQTELKLMSEEDHLGKSLLQMRDSLSKAREDEKQREEEERKRRWANEGVAKFADLLRKNNDDLEKLSYSIISNLVQYLEANQGGIFLVNDQDENDPFYELTAAYAFDRKKYLKREIRPGEGLVGTCALEGKHIYMTDLPQDYINITSGLGETNPDSLLLVPLKTEDEVLGVLEIASFNTFEQYQIDFVEKVAESIASTVSSVKTNLKTTQLLEKSQQQAEEMKSQEEEMRQNMEEMQSTQEELSRKMQDNEAMQKELSREKSLLDAIMNNLPDYIYFKDRESKFIRISKSMLPLFPVDSLDDMIGKSDFDFHPAEAAREMYNEEQQIIQQEKGFENKTQHEQTETGKEQWVSVTKLPLYDEEGNLMGTFGISKDITPFKKLEMEAREKNEKLEQRLKELEKTRKKAELRENELNGLNDLIDQFVWKAELDDQGKIVSANDLFLQQTGLKEKQAKERTIAELMDDPGQLDNLWEKVRQNENQKSQLKFKIKQGRQKELVASLIPLTNEDNEFSGVLFAGYDPSSKNS